MFVRSSVVKHCAWLKQVTPLLSSDAGPMTPEEAPKCSRFFGKTRNHPKSEMFFLGMQHK